MNQIIKTQSVLLEELIKQKQFSFKVICKKDALKREIDSIDINRPGLALAGWFEFFASNQIQVFGLTELEYLKSLEKEKKYNVIDKFFKYKNAAVIITRNIDPPEYIIKKALENDTPLIKTPLKASDLIRKLITFLDMKLNPRVIFHGELVEVYGVGILILGKSGIGKSECALELVKKRHILVADDIVEIYKTFNNELIGQGSEIIKNHLELRGIGIVNVKTLYGVGAIKDKVSLELVIEIEEWEKNKEYDRIGLNETTMQIQGVDVAKLCIPVKIGRNLSSIVEVAAMNYRSKKMGLYSVKEFNRKLINWIQGKSE
jgi:HPr kinase/phosphorylase